MSVRLPIASMLVAAVPVAGWAMHIPILMSFYPTSVTTKIATSTSLLMLGAAAIMRREPKLIAEAGMLAVMAWCIAVAPVVAYIFGHTASDVGLDEIDTVSPGVPSLGTVAAVAMLASAIVFGSTKRWFGIAVVLIALVALAGHLINVPVMYYYFDRFSTGLAIPTALSAGILGAEMLKLSKRAQGV